MGEAGRMPAVPGSAQFISRYFEVILVSEGMADYSNEVIS